MKEQLVLHPFCPSTVPHPHRRHCSPCQTGTEHMLHGELVFTLVRRASLLAGASGQTGLPLYRDWVSTVDLTVTGRGSWRPLPRAEGSAHPPPTPSTAPNLSYGGFRLYTVFPFNSTPLSLSLCLSLSLSLVPPPPLLPRVGLAGKTLRVGLGPPTGDLPRTGAG